MEVARKERKQRKSNSSPGQKHQNSIRGKSPRRIHPRLVSGWLAEVHVTPSMGELDHSGLVFDKHRMEFETLDSTIA